VPTRLDGWVPVGCPFFCGCWLAGWLAFAGFRRLLEKKRGTPPVPTRLRVGTGGVPLFLLLAGFRLFRQLLQKKRGTPPVPTRLRVGTGGVPLFLQKLAGFRRLLQKKRGTPPVPTRDRDG